MLEGTLEESLKLLRREYATKLPEALVVIETLWASLLQQWQDDKLDEFHARVHRLAGAGGSFGFAHLSAAARSLEVFLQELRHRTALVSPSELQHICRALDAIKLAANTPLSDEPLSSETDSRPRPSLPVGKLIYLVDDDNDLAQYLALQLQHRGYQVAVFNRVDDLPAAVRRRPPDALLMDIMLTEDDLAGPRIIYNIQRHRPEPLPVVFMSARVDMKARLASVRAHGRAYFTKPVDIPALIAKLDKLTQGVPPGPYQVLVVDDTGLLAERYVRWLREAAMQVKVLDKPMQFMMALDKFVPMLIMINAQLSSGLSGLELASIIQQQTEYESIPIIFFSAQPDEATRAAVLQGLAEDFLVEPVAANFLVTTVLHRIKKALLYQLEGHPQSASLGTHRDRLTGVYNRQYLQEQLEKAEKSLEYAHPPCVLAIALDHYSSIDQTLGIAGTEALLLETARLLQSQTQAQEVVARFSDNRFMVLTLNRPLAPVQAWADLVRRTLTQQVTLVEGSEVFSTCSIGIGVVNPGLTQAPDQAVQDAQAACQLSLAQGGNQVVLFANT